APSQIGSVEFAAERFGTRLVVVLGHSQCGAVLATLEELQQPTDNQSRNLRSIADRVRPWAASDNPWRRCCRPSSDTIRKLWCGTPFGPTSASLQASYATGRRF